MSWLGDLGGDLRWAMRTLHAKPGFAAVAATTLALGIGANSAIFTLINAHFLAPLPYEHPNTLVLLWETGRNSTDVTTVAPGNYWTWREEAGSFEDIAAFNVDFATLSGDGAAERVTASIVSPHFFEVLGARPALGPGFNDASVRANGVEQVILGHALWMRRYGGDPGVIGSDIRIDGRSYTIQGIMPPTFRQPERSLSWQVTEVWRPVLLDGSRDDFGSRYLRTVARLRPGASVEQARSEMSAMAARLALMHPESNGGRTVLVRTLDEYLLGAARPTLLLLMGAGVAVLLIVCANVANLTLARGQERRREFVLRAALGSGTTRLIRQVIIESVTLACIGAFAGIAVLLAGRSLLQAIQVRYFSGLVDVTVDWRVVAFTVVLAIGAGILFSLPLARSASRPELRGALGEGSERSGGSARANRVRDLLIVGQVGLATTLLVIATLLARSFNELVNVPPGFRADDIVTFTVAAPSATYSDASAIDRYHRDILARVSSIPGVDGVGMVSDLMFTTENMWTTVGIDGNDSEDAAAPRTEFHVVLPSYFEVLDIPIREGTVPPDRRYIDEIPVVVNERMAELHWPAGNALGSSFTTESGGASDRILRVHAIAGNMLDDGYDAAAEPAFFIPFGASPWRRMSYLVRTSDGSALAEPIRAAVAQVDPDIPAADLQLLESMLAESVARPRAASLIGLTFALIALLVSASGIYGLLSYAVEARTREIGIRSALGATGSQLISMVMGHSTRLVVIGLVLGVLGALVAGRAISGLLFGVRSWDPISLAGAAVILGAVGSFAAWIPARRAVRVDPRDALRIR